MIRRLQCNSLVRSSLLMVLMLVQPSLHATTDAEEVLRREFRAALDRAAASGAFDHHSVDQLSWSISLPAERRVDLGLLLDSRGPALDGLVILGTTPGGTAQALGLRAGDVVVAIGSTVLAGLGVDAAGAANAVGPFKAALAALADRAPLSLSVLRGGHALRLTGSLEARYLPALRVELGERNLVASPAPAALASSGQTVSATDGHCGRISTFHMAPRRQRLFAAKVLLIDGRTPGTPSQDTYRLMPGRYTVLVVEDIDPVELAGTLLRRRDTLGRKSLEVLVEANQTAMIAARLIGHGNESSYWEPVVWKSIAEDCR